MGVRETSWTYVFHSCTINYIILLGLLASFAKCAGASPDHQREEEKAQGGRRAVGEKGMEGRGKEDNWFRLVWRGRGRNTIMVDSIGEATEVGGGKTKVQR